MFNLKLQASHPPSIKCKTKLQTLRCDAFRSHGKTATCFETVSISILTYLPLPLPLPLLPRLPLPRHPRSRCGWRCIPVACRSTSSHCSTADHAPVAAARNNRHTRNMQPGRCYPLSSVCVRCVGKSKGGGGVREQKENTISMLYLTECGLSSSFPNLGFRFAMEINRSRTQVCLGGSFVATVLTCCISPRSRCRSRAPSRAPGPYRTGPAGPPVPDQGQFPPVCFVRADRASAYRFRPGWLPLHSGRVIRLQTEQVNEKGIS